MIVGPSFRPNVLRLSEKIGYPVELFQVTRFLEEKEAFVLVERLESAEEARPPKITKGMEVYDWEFYEREHGKEAVEEMRRAAEGVDELAKKHGWNIRMHLKKLYVGFKYGNVNAFSVNWWGTHAWKVHLRVPKEEAEKFQATNWQLQRYDEGWKQAVFRRTSDGASVSELEALFARAYERTRGKL